MLILLTEIIERLRETRGVKDTVRVGYVLSTSRQPVQFCTAGAKMNPRCGRTDTHFSHKFRNAISRS